MKQIPGCSKIHDYKKIEKVGEGTFGYELCNEGKYSKPSTFPHNK